MEKEIKNAIRAARKKEGKTIEQVADELGVSRQTVSNWESGKATPDTEKFMKMVEIYNPSMVDVRGMLGISTTEAIVEKNFLPLENVGKTAFEFNKEKISNYFLKGKKKVTYPSVVHFYMDEYLSECYNDCWTYYPNETDDAVLTRMVIKCLKTYANYTTYEKSYMTACITQHLKNHGILVSAIHAENGDFSFIATDEEQLKCVSQEIYRVLYVVGTSELKAQQKLIFENIEKEYREIISKIDKFCGKIDESVLGDFPLGAEDDGFYEDKVILTFINTADKKDPITRLYLADDIDNLINEIASNYANLNKLVDNETTAFAIEDFRSKPDKIVESAEKKDTPITYRGFTFYYYHHNLEQEKNDE